MARVNRFRIQSKPEWRVLVSGVEQAPASVLSACLKIARVHAIEVLSEAGWEGLAALRPAIAQGAAGRDRIKSEAEAADRRDLVFSAELDDLRTNAAEEAARERSPFSDPEADDDLPDLDPVASVRAHELFVIARALSALVHTADASSNATTLAHAVLEGIFELSVTSEDRNARLQREIEAATRMA